MNGLFGAIKPEKYRVQKERDMDKEILNFLEKVGKASLRLIAGHLKLSQNHMGLQNCLNVMRQRGQIEYDTYTMDWVLRTKNRGLD